MTMPNTILSLIVLIFSSGSLCAGWGNRFEIGNGRRFAGRSAMVANENHDSFENEDPTTIETSIHIEDYVQVGIANPHILLDLVRERADELAAETFAGYMKEQACRGEECDRECLIPEEWTLTSGDMDSTEVMNFLGIRRAQPLRRSVDWE